MVKLSNKLGLVETLILICILTTKKASTENVSTHGILYFGFFFDAETASYLKSITDLYLNTLKTDIPEFSSFLGNVSSTANVTNPMTFYTKPLDPNTEDYDPLYHTTAKYCGQNQEGCKEYEKNNSKFIDAKFEMSLVGFVLTARTFGIRVNLTSEQTTLFDEDNGKNKVSVFDDKNTPFSTLPSLLPEYPFGVRLERQDPFPPALPATVTKAHVTVGCAPNVSAVTTGPDALETIKYERMADEDGSKISWTTIVDPLDPDKHEMKVTLFKPNATSPPKDYLFVIYPQIKVVANATLARYYQKETSSGVNKIDCKNSSFLISVSVFSHLACLFVGKFLNY